MNRDIIQPRTLRGFADLLPSVGLYRRTMLRVIEDTFTSYGFDPIQTPAIEYLEILKGKGGEESDKQMFEFEDRGGRRVGLRYDLTVPLARFVAEHQSSLTFPFRAYNIGYVWRGDRPQRGRFREFLQCDADIIGDSGVSADAEIVSIAESVLSRIDVGPFVVRINNRHVLNGLLADLHLDDRIIPVLRALDKIEKIGEEGVTAELREVGVPDAAVERVLALIACRGETNEDTIAAVSQLIPPQGEAATGLAEVRQTLELAGGRGSIRFDPSIVRGLDYYTGMVYEIQLLDAPEVGSVGGGGRYDNLTGLYQRNSLSGVGGTIGISRIIAAIEGTDRFPEVSRERPLIVVTSGAAPTEDARLAALIRGMGEFDVDLYPAQAKHSVQMKYADVRRARFVVTRDPGDAVSIKDMSSGDRISCRLDDLADTLQKLS
ncbi:histidine--tRNA ligase [Nonomuraea sp. SYSU D8015]|uniref:histidine--tRNA ligase n=1 Tax=Nonomuraea sp. SYSU D8015 TaxID=2593644 RepID=UPI001660E90C|nr:histidine--tRNA ligase [Nonomuraea sp. SYSU D8015]